MIKTDCIYYIAKTGGCKLFNGAEIKNCKGCFAYVESIKNNNENE